MKSPGNLPASTPTPNESGMYDVVSTRIYYRYRHALMINFRNRIVHYSYSLLARIFHNFRLPAGEAGLLKENCAHPRFDFIKTWQLIIYFSISLDVSREGHLLGCDWNESDGISSVSIPRSITADVYSITETGNTCPSTIFLPFFCITFTL